MTPRSPNAVPFPAGATAPLELPPVVLVAEDDRLVVELLCRLLQADHFRVLTAANGEDALAVAEKSMPDLVVTDVGMPRLDGFGLIRGLRHLYPDIPVIVLSGEDWYTGRPVTTVAAELGALATFMKPLDVPLLRQAVRSALFPNGDYLPTA
jgi:DNA-binding response OmpR family regulator